MKKFSHYILLSIIILLASGLYIACTLIYKTDISTRQITHDPYNLTRKAPVYLVSYADGHEVFSRNQLSLAESALGRGVDIIANYRYEMIDPKFIESNKEIFSHKFGAGYWLWKPWIILDQMKKAPEDAYIVYSDSGFVLKSNITDLLNLTDDKPIVLIEYEDRSTYKPLISFAKRDLLVKLDMDFPQYYNSRPIWAGFMILRNNKTSRAFVERWLKLCQDPHLITNEPSIRPEHLEFSHHMHDQAILAALAAKSKDITYVPYDSVLQKNYGTWHHRTPKAMPEDPNFIYNSLKPYYAIEHKKMKSFQKAFYNNTFFKHLRRYSFSDSLDKDKS